MSRCYILVLMPPDSGVPIETKSQLPKSAWGFFSSEPAPVPMSYQTIADFLYAAQPKPKSDPRIVPKVEYPKPWLQENKSFYLENNLDPSKQTWYGFSDIKKQLTSYIVYIIRQRPRQLRLLEGSFKPWLVEVELSLPLPQIIPAAAISKVFQVNIACPGNISIGRGLRMVFPDMEPPFSATKAVSYDGEPF